MGFKDLYLALAWSPKSRVLADTSPFHVLSGRSLSGVSRIRMLVMKVVILGTSFAGGLYRRFRLQLDSL